MSEACGRSQPYAIAEEVEKEVAYGDRPEQF